MRIKKYYAPPAAFFTAGDDIYLSYSFNKKKTFLIRKKAAHKYSKISGINNYESFIKELTDFPDVYNEISNPEQLFGEMEEKGLISTTPESINPEIEPESSIFSIAFITNNRPEYLAKSLESTAENLLKNKHKIRATVFDDSSDPKTAEINKQIINDIKTRYPIIISYTGKKEKNILINNILKSSGESSKIKKSLDFAINGYREEKILNGPGGNRNTSILVCAGQKLISFDDDINFSAVCSNEVSSDIEIAGKKDPEKHLFSGFKTAEKNYSETGNDIITYIKNVLGKPVIDCISTAEKMGGSLLSENFRAEPGFSFNKDEPSVKAVTCGLYGGKWFSNPFGMFFNKNEIESSDYKKKSDYNYIKKKPVSLMLQKNLLLTRAPFFVASAMGIDTSEIPPPFPPIGRNQDGIWSVVMLALYQNTFISHIPFAVYHEINNKIEFTDSDYKDTTAAFGMMTVLITEYIKHRLYFLYRTAAFSTIGNEFINIASVSDNKFISFCHDLWLEFTGNSISRLETLLNEYRGKPHHWGNDAEKYLETLQKQSSVPENSIPKELRKDFGINEAVKTYKRFLMDYGELMINWTAIWKAALQVNKSGKS